jgi:hypothetical protein
MLHAVAVILFECITEIESIISILQGFFFRVSSMFSIQLSHNIFILSHSTHSLVALEDI